MQSFVFAILILLMSPAYSATAGQKTLIIYDSFSARHDHPGQLEGAWRLKELMPTVTEFTNRKQNYASKDFAKNPSINLPAILDAHSKSYAEQLKNFKSPKAGYLCSNRWCPYLLNSSYSVAARASTMTVEAVRLVHEKQFANAFSLTRPPGHHAKRESGDGFCLFNHVAIAAKYLVKQLKYNRVAIVDLDVHHGNGTEDIIFGDPKIRYYSTHQHPAWPFTGAADEKNPTVTNLPLQPGSSSSILLRKTQDRILKALDEFQPEFILVSVGYDFHYRDPLGVLQYDSRDILDLHKGFIEYARQKSQGRIVFVLEGGYNREALVDGVSNTLSTLQGLSLFKDQNGPKKVE